MYDERDTPIYTTYDSDVEWHPSGFSYYYNYTMTEGAMNLNGEKMRNSDDNSLKNKQQLYITIVKYGPF